MPCYHPIPAWMSRVVNRDTGKRGISFSVRDSFCDLPIALPCGKCIGCVQVRGNSWALRCVHESRMHKFSWFVTLTYSPVNMPVNGSLSKRHWQLFMKRFRESFGPVRYFMCGQYGERTLRPHYHALLFGVDFPDKRLYVTVKDGGSKLFVSRTLDELWGLGECKFSELNPATVRYVTNYMGRSCLDKEMCGRFGLEPEFQLMSRKPGLGFEWLKKYETDVYPDGYVTVKGGSKVKVPRYYDDIMTKKAPDVMFGIRARRKYDVKDDPDSTGSRLVVREVVAQSKRKLFSGNDPDD